MQLLPKEEAVLKLLEDPVYENYFFNIVENTKWFFPLNEKGYFAPEKAPGPKPADQEGYFTIPQWNILPYLERVSQHVDEPDNEKYVDELLKIIKDVSNYRDSSEKHIDNYRTWWYFVKILLNIPNNKIPVDILELIPVWLDSKFKVGLAGADVATKLLPKFLDSDNPEDWMKAEKIVEGIISIKLVEMAEERRGLLGKEKEAETILDDYWLMEAFKANAGKVGERCSENIIFTIADKLKEIFRGEHPQSFLKFEFQNRSYLITIEHRQDFEFQGTVGVVKDTDSKSQDPAERLFREVKPETEELFDFEIKNCKDIKSFITSIKEKTAEHPEFKDLNTELDEKIANLYEGIFSDYSYIWFDSLFSVTDPYIHGAREILTLILRDVTLAKAKKDKKSAKRIFERFLGVEYQYPLFKRIVLYVIGKAWEGYNELFRQIIGKKDGELLFDNSYFKPEIYTLLENNVSKLSREEEEKLEVIIEKGPQRYVPKDKPEKYIAYWRQEWYSALKSDSYFAQLYEKQKKITGLEEEITFKGVGMRFREGTSSSPLSKEEIIKMSNEDIAGILLTFETKDRWNGPSVEGLSGILKSTVQEKPGKFIENLVPFLDVGYLYICDILEGINEAWNQKKSIDWKKLLEFIKNYIDRKDFWGDKYIVQDNDYKADHKWVVTSIGRLIQDGTKDDEWAFSEELLPCTQYILFLILDNEKADEGQTKDALNYTLNSHIGKIITALIYLALRIARVEDKKGLKREPKWSTEIKAYYEKTLHAGIIEAYTLLGQYMANLYYLDRDWIKEKITQICLGTHKQLWDVFMQGYLFGSRVYDNLYKLMRPHYLSAMDYVFKESDINQRLVEHISLQYLWGKETIEKPDSLFWILLDRWDVSQIKEIISFFWMQRDYLGENVENRPKVEKPLELQKMKERIIEFWRWVYRNKFGGKEPETLSEEDKRILSYLSKLTVFLSAIDSENSNWLIASARYVHLDFNSPFFIEYLDNLKDKDTSKYVGEIYLEILDDFAPDYDRKHIYSIVEFLYQSSEKVNADKICNIYGTRELYFLRDLYEKNQK